MKELQELARTLLSEGQVKVVVGWEDSPGGPRPAFITRPEDAERLVFDHRCVHNLVAYLSPGHVDVARLGKPAVVVKGCDARAAAMLMRESQLSREDVVLIGVRCGGVVRDPREADTLTADSVAPRCPGCDARQPALADHLLGELPPPPPGENRRDKEIARLEAMRPSERWAFWQAELARCVRCNACRQVCPLCYCERCVALKTEPLWIESSAHPRGVMAWHLTRAQHHAGRCSDCGECERACPVSIMLSLLNRKAAQVVEQRFGYVASDDPAAPAPIGAFRTEDTEEFIR
ncbi:MAG TPA: Fe-S oxidoreductase [Armatimonadota bacterium]